MAEADASFDRILQTLLEKRGLDFNEYRRSFLARRMECRLQAHYVKDFASYEKILESQPNEWNELFDSLTINVAEFFRDSPVWEFLIKDILTPMIKRGKPLRIWSAGCASGEEPYTIAMAVKEIARNIPCHGHVKIMASDVDPLALQRARVGIYGPNALKQVASQRLRIFFVMARAKGSDGCFEVVPEIKSMVQFSEHNYLEPAPAMDRLDMVFCRNSMIYLKNEAKEKAVSKFYRALLPNGYLVLGVTEVLIGEAHYHQFRAIKEQPGIFQKLSQ